MIKDKLAIITNEKVFSKNKYYFCDNVEMKSLPEDLNKNFEIKLFIRNSKEVKTAHKINLSNIISSRGLISYLKNIFKTLKNYDKYLIISISPLTFLVILLLTIFKKKIFVYLRSRGDEEYKFHSKFFGPIIYNFMFNFISKRTKLFACGQRVLKKKEGFVISPSQLNKNWLINRKPPDLNNLKLLYVGRVRKEKGIFSLVKLLEEIKSNFTLTIVNPEKNYEEKFKNKMIKVIQFEESHEEMIKIYDDHNIFILPSFTEGYSMVLDESLSRLRPAIIFKDISYVKRNREGIFIAERESGSLSNTINYINKNYFNIQKKMNSNKFPSRETFLKEVTNIITEKNDKK